MTRIAWEQLKQQAANLGIARSALYPTLAINVPAMTARQFVVFPEKVFPVLGADSERLDVTTVNPVVALNYLLFDFGGRRGSIDAAKASLFTAGTALNDTHEQVAIGVTTNYYRVVSSKGLVDAARASLKDAQSTEQQVHDQLNHGLATLPNFLNAQAQEQQAEYNLKNAEGNEEIATSALAQSAGLNPAVPVMVKDISEMPERSELEASVEKLINRALVQRPTYWSRSAESAPPTWRLRLRVPRCIQPLRFKHRAAMIHSDPTQTRVRRPTFIREIGKGSFP